MQKVEVEARSFRALDGKGRVWRVLLWLMERGWKVLSTHVT